MTVIADMLDGSSCELLEAKVGDDLVPNRQPHAMLLQFITTLLFISRKLNLLV